MVWDSDGLARTADLHAEALEITRILVPRDAGVLSAAGMLATRVSTCRSVRGEGGTHSETGTSFATGTVRDMRAPCALALRAAVR